jgi:helix-turn-helix resolvase-like protein
VQFRHIRPKFPEYYGDPVLAEYQRELIVANTRDGLAAARSRGKVGGQPARLTADQVQLAQQLYAAGGHTVQQIADMFSVPRSTVYGHLNAGEYVRVIYRNSTPKADQDTSRPYGETGQGGETLMKADDRYHRIARDKRHLLRAMVFVCDGVVTRIRPVNPDGEWTPNPNGNGKVVVPLGDPLDDDQIAEQFPTLHIRNGDQRPRQRGRLWETIAL